MALNACRLAALVTLVLVGSIRAQGVAQRVPLLPPIHLDTLPDRLRPTVYLVRPAERQSQASWFESDRSFSILEENDAFATVKPTSDNSYTQGLRASWDFAINPDGIVRVADRLSLSNRLAVGMAKHYFRIPCNSSAGLLPTNSHVACTSVRVSVTQTEFTPESLTIASRNLRDRPYAALLFASLGVTTRTASVSSTTELSVGVMGPLALGEATQSLAHWTWAFDRPRPQGWRYQLGNAPQISLMNSAAVAAARICGKFWMNGIRSVLTSCDSAVTRNSDLRFIPPRIFDLQFLPELVVGTLMQRTSLGARIRLGWKIDRAATENRIPETLLNFELRETPSTTSAKHSAQSARALQLKPFCERLGALASTIWFAGFIEWHARGVLGNAMISGTRWSDAGADGWRTRTEIAGRGDVYERAYGITGGVGSLAFSWQQVWRSPELQEFGSSHRFGALSITLSSNARR